MSDNFDYDGLSQTAKSLSIDSFDSLANKIRGKKVCLFLGAGFSKAWDDKYPLSDDVFSISAEEASENHSSYGFLSLFEELNLKWHPESVDKKLRASVFKNFKFNLDIYRRYPSLLPSYLDKQTLDFFEKQVKLFIKSKFSTLLPSSELSLSRRGSSRVHKSNMVRFFKGLDKLTTGLDVITTNYDIVIDKILKEAIPNKTLVRGFPVHYNNVVQCPKKGGVGLYKLNGGFEVVPQGETFKIDYDSLNSKDICPNIILPSNEQDYGDKYFKSVFLKSSSQLRMADMLIFIGYSFPSEDHIIQFLLKTFMDSENKEKEALIVSRSEKSAIECHSRASVIFSELNDVGGVYYFKGSFLDMCKNV
ncbi:SIR2 family protein [Klebsiella oxytoca]|uniref:SIR2 family protein n=1 Tax=Klebsiella oxytoca TaxID=571 RepID=UPI002DB80125|nr:SIR2 family protein [Klebsiella oxytoca]MEB7878571.1 SIR2 family protein [Klebsiella oxytoca]